MKINKSLISGSITLLIAFNLFNFLNFIFHFSMARLLSVVEFGILATLFSIIYILAGFTDSIQVVITKYAASEKNKKKLNYVLGRSLKGAFFVSLALFLAYLVISIFISSLTKINYFLVAITGLIIFASFTIPITRGMLQGKKRFKSLGSNMVLESLIKLILAIGLVFLGWSVLGAMAGAIIGSLSAVALSLISLRDITKSPKEKTSIETLYQYGKPSFFLIIMLLIFYSIDIFIAKVVFPADIAGAYAIASILAKIIFLGTRPISKAMFPMSVENTSNKKLSENIFANALVLLSLAIISALVIFYFFPELIILIFSGKVIPAASHILFYLAIATSLLSITNVVLLYKLSVNKVRGYPLLSIFVLVEIFLLSYFSANLLQFSVAFVAASAALLWGTLFILREE